mmetsp:Transcript_33061/g.50703  ORF Transcript_33061/g.50703 Transcript_33061/m.50703 type:complete len:211 (+) Transcript_33061:385-1017(+)
MAHFRLACFHLGFEHTLDLGLLIVFFFFMGEEVFACLIKIVLLGPFSVAHGNGWSQFLMPNPPVLDRSLLEGFLKEFDLSMVHVEFALVGTTNELMVLQLRQVLLARPIEIDLVRWHIVQVLAAMVHVVSAHLQVGSVLLGVLLLLLGRLLLGLLLQMLGLLLMLLGKCLRLTLRELKLLHLLLLLLLSLLQLEMRHVELLVKKEGFSLG